MSDINEKKLKQATKAIMKFGETQEFSAAEKKHLIMGFLTAVDDVLPLPNSPLRENT